MGLYEYLRRLARRAYLEVGGAYVRAAAVGGSAAIAFLAVWPLSTVIVVALVAATAPAVSRFHRRGRPAPVGPADRSA